MIHLIQTRILWWY